MSGGRRPPAEVSCRSSTSLRLVLPPELGVFCVRGPADELSVVIEFPRQYELCHYTHVALVYIHYPAACFLLLSDAVGGNSTPVYSTHPQTEWQRNSLVKNTLKQLSSAFLVFKDIKRPPQRRGLSYFNSFQPYCSKSRVTDSDFIRSQAASYFLS